MFLRTVIKVIQFFLVLNLGIRTKKVILTKKKDKIKSALYLFQTETYRSEIYMIFFSRLCVPQMIDSSTAYTVLRPISIMLIYETDCLQ